MVPFRPRAYGRFKIFQVAHRWPANAPQGQHQDVASSNGSAAWSAHARATSACCMRPQQPCGRQPLCGLRILSGPESATTENTKTQHWFASISGEFPRQYFPPYSQAITPLFYSTTHARSQMCKFSVGMRNPAATDQFAVDVPSTMSNSSPYAPTKSAEVGLSHFFFCFFFDFVLAFDL